MVNSECSASSALTSDEIMQVVADNLGDCLTYSTSTGLNVKVDPSSQNSTSCGENGIITPDGGSGTVVCRDLKDPDFAGAFGGYALGRGWGSPEAVEYALTHDLVLHNWIIDTVDGSAMWAVGSPGMRYNYISSFASTALGQSVLAAGDMEAMPPTPGDPTGAVWTPSEEKAPASRLTNAKGYLGGAHNSFQPMSLDRVLRWVQCRTTVIADCSRGTSRTVATALAAILGANAGSWTILVVAVDQLDAVADIVAAGVTVCIDVSSAPGTDPATITATGATWVQFNDSDTTYAQRTVFYNTDGLSCMTHVISSRQYFAADEISAGANMIISYDPRYTRGCLGEGYRDFEQLTAHTAASGGFIEGQLTHWTDEGNLFGRGYGVNAASNSTVNAFCTYAGTVDYPAGGSYEMLYTNVALAITDPTNYSLRFRFNTSNIQSTITGGLMGCFIAGVDDRDAAVGSGYLAWVNMNPSSGGTLLNVQKNVNGTATLVGTDGTGGLSIGTRYFLTVAVSATALTFTLNAYSGGVPGSRLAQVDVTDADYRGRVFQFAQRGATATPFEGAWAQVIVNNTDTSFRALAAEPADPFAQLPHPEPVTAGTGDQGPDIED